MFFNWVQPKPQLQVRAYLVLGYIDQVTRPNAKQTRTSKKVVESNYELKTKFL